MYRGTSLIRNIPLSGPYSRTMPRALWWPHGRGLFLLSEVSLYRGTSHIINSSPPYGPPKGPRLSPTEGSWGGDVSYERGTPVIVSEGVHTCAVLEVQGLLEIKNTHRPGVLR